VLLLTRTRLSSCDREVDTSGYAPEPLEGEWTMTRHRISALLAILGALLTVALGATAAAAQAPVKEP
jgi:hypothetical protein